MEVAISLRPCVLVTHSHSVIYIVLQPWPRACSWCRHGPSRRWRDTTTTFVKSRDNLTGHSSERLYNIFFALSYFTQQCQKWVGKLLCTLN